MAIAWEYAPSWEDEVMKLWSADIKLKLLPAALAVPDFFVVLRPFRCSRSVLIQTLVVVGELI